VVSHRQDALQNPFLRYVRRRPVVGRLPYKRRQALRHFRQIFEVVKRRYICHLHGSASLPRENIV